MSPIEIRWIQVVKWVQVNPIEIKWIQVSLSEGEWILDSYWIWMSPSEISGSKLVQVRSSEIKWVQMGSSESKWGLVHLHDPKWDQGKRSPSEIKRDRLSPCFSKSDQVRLTKIKWVQVNSHHQVNPGETKGMQVSPSDIKWDPLSPESASQFKWDPAPLQPYPPAVGFIGK